MIDSVITKELNFRTKGVDDIIDITPKVQNELGRAGLRDGIVTVFVPGSTGAVTTIEYEPGLLQDLPELYEKIASKSRTYAHDRTWGDGNGFSHLRAALQGASLTVPFSKGKLTLGTWQQIVFLEFDNRGRQRTVVLQFMGK